MVPSMSDTPQTGTASSCPRCQTSLTSLRNNRWCGQCEWNLDRFDPDRHQRTFGWTWLDRWAHRLAYRLNTRLFTALTGADLTTAGGGAARVTVLVLSAGLVAGVLAMYAGGLLLILVDFPSIRIIPGVLLVFFAFALRPRFGRVDPSLERLTPDQAPTLFALVDRVAAELGVPRPQVIGCDRAFTAYAGAVGVRRHRVLGLGLPLWVILPPRQRVALLAHELGHFVNGDVRRGPLTQPVFTTLGRAAVLTAPDQRDVEEAAGFAVIFAAAIHLVQWLVSRVLWLLHLLLVWVGLRDAQRAEYLADDRAAAVAGSAGARELLDSLVIGEPSRRMVARAARASAEVDSWRPPSTTPASASPASCRSAASSRSPTRRRCSPATRHPGCAAGCSSPGRGARPGSASPTRSRPGSTRSWRRSTPGPAGRSAGSAEPLRRSGSYLRPMQVVSDAGSIRCR